MRKNKIMKKSFTIYILTVAISACASVNYFSQTNSVKNNDSKTCVILAKEGDTIKSIAKRYKLPVTELARFNGLFEHTILRKGRVVRLFYKDGNKPTGCISLKKQKKKN